MKQRNGFAILGFIILFLLVVLMVSILYFYPTKNSSSLKKYETITVVNKSSTSNLSIDNAVNVKGNLKSGEAEPAQPKAIKKITSCDSIKEPGEYIMDADLIAYGNGCINLESMNGIFIDCKGHMIKLDQENKPLNEERMPILGLKNIKNFSIRSCIIKIINPSSAPSTVVISDSSDGSISGNVFYDPNIISDGVDDFSISLDYTSRISFSNNVVYGVYQQHFSTNNLIENNKFLPSLKTLKQLTDPIGLDHGSNNTIIKNQIDGKWDGSDPNLHVGADDGIAFAYESGDFIGYNDIKNNWDCGIESAGLIEDTQIISNHITNSGVCGIGAWYWNSWKGNTVKDNIVDLAPQMFLFLRAYPLKAEEDAVYFIDNTFSNNRFLNPSDYISATFAFKPYSGGGTKGGKADTTPYVVNNNHFSDNDFNRNVRAPFFGPSSMVFDDGGNICGEIAQGDYSNQADFPLKCR